MERKSELLSLILYWFLLLSTRFDNTFTKTQSIYIFDYPKLSLQSQPHQWFPLPYPIQRYRSSSRCCSTDCDLRFVAKHGDQLLLQSMAKPNISVMHLFWWLFQWVKWWVSGRFVLYFRMVWTFRHGFFVDKQAIWSFWIISDLEKPGLYLFTIPRSTNCKELCVWRGWC